MHVENRSRKDSDKLCELSAEHALLRSYQHERKQKTPPCAISRRPRTRRPEQLLQKRHQSFSFGPRFRALEVRRVRGTYDFWRPKICLWTDHHTWWGGQTPEYELCFVRVLTIDACGQALSAPSISKTVLENSPVLEPFKKSLPTTAYSCNEFLVFMRVLISPHNYLAWFTSMSTISNNSITLFNLKIKGIFIPTFFQNFLFTSTKKRHVMCCWLTA